MNLVKKCTECGEEKSLDNFNKLSAAIDGLQKHCKICVSLYNKERYKGKREIMIAQAINWRKNNPVRFKEIRKQREKKIREIKRIERESRE